MTIQALEIMKTAFSACVTWTNQLFAAVDGSGVVLAAFCITLVVGLLFIPLRGGNFVAGWDTFRDFNTQVTHKGKYQSGSWAKGTRSIARKGKFQQGNNSSRVVRKGKHTSYDVYHG